MSEQLTLANELTGSSAIQTDHGGIGIGDIIVLLLDAVLLVYTAWRSFDFLTTTVPDGFQVLALIGLWGLDIGAVAWSLVWIFGSSARYQDWVSMAFFLIDLVGVFLTSVTDSLMYGSKDGAMTAVLMGIATVAIPMVVFANVAAGFIYHMTSPETKSRRSDRKAKAEHVEKMSDIRKMERDLVYAESYLLARQETLDKATLLAEIKTAQDAVEKATRSKLRDQVGIAQNANSMSDQGVDRLAGMKEHLEGLRKKLTGLGGGAISSAAPAANDLAPIIAPIPEPSLANGNGNGHGPDPH
jgi:hypothetical protein